MNTHDFSKSAGHDKSSVRLPILRYIGEMWKVVLPYCHKNDKKAKLQHFFMGIKAHDIGNSAWHDKRYVEFPYMLHISKEQQTILQYNSNNNVKTAKLQHFFKNIIKVMISARRQSITNVLPLCRLCGISARCSKLFWPIVVKTANQQNGHTFLLIWVFMLSASR